MINGFINVLKPPGMTSHDVVNYLRRLFNQKKIGHNGTLDPAAAGVLPIALGKATRVLEFIEKDQKGYIVEVLFGVKTDTGDDTGDILEKSPFSMPNKDLVIEVLNSFLGESLQKPPIYSAIKINGKKAYDLARNNKEIDIPPRKIKIYSIDFREITKEGFTFSVRCSKGTYIRSLVTDIGTKLGLLSTMKFLIRDKSGIFLLEDSFSLEEITLLREKIIKNIDYPLTMKKIILDKKQCQDFSQGKRLKVNFSPLDCSFLRVYDDEGNLYGISRFDKEKNILHPYKVIV